MAASQRLYRMVAHSANTQLRFPDWNHSDREAMAAILRDIARDFKQDNTAFRYDRFFKACGLDGFGYVPKDGIIERKPL